MNRVHVRTLLLVLAGSVMLVACGGPPDQDQQAGDQLKQGVVYFKNGKFEDAVRLLEPYALSGDASSCRFVGLAYALGLGVSPDVEKAKKIFGYAASDAASNYFMVGKELEERARQNEDSDAAFGWYAEAAELGSRSAAVRIADAYSKGELGLTVDATKAHYWIQKSEEL